MRLISRPLALLALLLLSAGCGRDEDGSQEGVLADTSGPVAPRAFDSLGTGLVLAGHTLEQGQQVLSGSVVNNTTQPYVNVQVRFDLVSSDSTVSATVADSTSEVGPGETWSFRISLPSEGSIAKARLKALTGTPRTTTDPLSTETDAAQERAREGATRRKDGPE